MGPHEGGRRRGGGSIKVSREAARTDIATVSAASAGMFRTHVPFDEPPDLPFGIAVLHHPSDEIVVFLFGLAVLLRAERNHRQQVFGLREYPLFHHFPDFFV